MEKRHIPLSKSTPIIFIISLIFLWGSWCHPAAGKERPANLPPDVVSVRAIWSLDSAQPNSLVVLAVVFDIAPGFHINADKNQLASDKGFNPIPTQVRVLERSPGVVLAGAHFPRAIALRAEYADTPLMVFHGRTVVYLPLQVSDQANDGTLSVKLEVTYQACDERICMFPQTLTLSASLPYVSAGGRPGATHPEVFRDYFRAGPTKDTTTVDFDLFGWSFSVNPSSWIGQVVFLLIAALGGLLLNLTPCVLPLIPIKIINLSNVAENRERCLILGTAMFLGVVAFWAALGIMIAAVAGFTAVNQLFQYPVFTIGVGVVIGVMGLLSTGFLGERGLPLPGFVYRFNPKQETPFGSFCLGILTAVLSTPCTAPFMGAAAAWAATQRPFTTLTGFTAIGVGMAVPYLILSIMPGVLSKMPRSGYAGKLVKEVMGLLMLAAASYFIGVGISVYFSRPGVHPADTYWWIVMGFVALAGLWLTVQSIRHAKGVGIKIVGVLLGGVLVVSGSMGGVRLTDRGPIDWIAYTPERFESALSGQKVILAVFTADWCLNCKALEESVFHNQKLIRVLEEPFIAPMRIDITGSNPDGKVKLTSTGRLTIPLLVVYSKKGDILFLSDFYTADQVIGALREAQNR